MNIRALMLLFLMTTLIGCSSATELEGRWQFDRNIADMVREYGNVDSKIANMIGAVLEENEEYVITRKTVTHIHKFGSNISSYTDPYKVYEKGPSYIVLEIGRKDDKKLVRFDLLSEDEVRVEGRIFTRVRNEEQKG
jgi:hypothetical protein